MNWLDVNGNEFNLADHPKAIGFIYEIFYTNGQRYIGKKNFFDTVTLPKNSNRKKKEVFLREKTDWKQYTGSHKTAVGLQIKSKHIIALANTKRALTYLEVKYLFEADVIFNEQFLNENIGGKYFDNVLDDLKEPLRKEYR
jgi:hypothetical protein